ARCGPDRGPFPREVLQAIAHAADRANGFTQRGAAVAWVEQAWHSPPHFALRVGCGSRALAVLGRRCAPRGAAVRPCARLPRTPTCDEIRGRSGAACGSAL